MAYVEARAGKVAAERDGRVAPRPSTPRSEGVPRRPDNRSAKNLIVVGMALTLGQLRYWRDRLGRPDLTPGQAAYHRDRE